MRLNSPFEELMEKTILYLSEPGEKAQERPRHVLRLVPVHVSHHCQGGRQRHRPQVWLCVPKLIPCFLLRVAHRCLSWANQHKCSQGIGALPTSPTTLCYWSQHRQFPGEQPSTRAERRNQTSYGQVETIGF